LYLKNEEGRSTRDHPTQIWRAKKTQKQQIRREKKEEGAGVSWWEVTSGSVLTGCKKAKWDRAVCSHNRLELRCTKKKLKVVIPGGREKKKVQASTSDI